MGYDCMSCILGNLVVLEKTREHCYIVALLYLYTLDQFQARRHYIFDSLQRTADDSIIEFAPQIANIAKVNVKEIFV